MEYFSSPSARRCMVKQSHCFFCDLTMDGDEFWLHLTEREFCRDLYARFLNTRMMGLNSVKSIMVRFYGCILCRISSRIGLKVHLSRNWECLQYYKIKFGIEDLNKLCNHVSRLKLVTETKEARAERFQIQKRKNGQVKSISMVECLNNFRKSVQLANYKTCITCKSNVNEHGASEVNPETIDVDVNLELLKLRRLGKFWLCNQCSKNGDANLSSGRPSVILESCNLEDRRMFHVNVDGIVDVERENEELNISHTIDTVMFPVTCESVENLVKEPAKLKSHGQISRDLSVTRHLTVRDLAMIYENELKKYLKAANSGNLFVGSYDMNGALADVIKLKLDGNITCSKSWYKLQHSHMISRMEQFGMFCFYLSVEIPLSSMDVIATALIVEGIVITCTNHGLECGELTTNYLVHTTHKSNVHCVEDCPTVDLAEYILNHEDIISTLLKKHVATYVSSAHQKLNCWGKHIIGASSSSMYAEDFHLSIRFDLRGAAFIEGLIWPIHMSVFNESIAQNIEIDDDSLVSFLDNVVVATTDLHYIMSTFQYSESEAKKIVELVEKYQNKNLASADSKAELPSLYTIVQHKPLDSRNHEVSKRWRNLFLSKLVELDPTTHEMSSLEWLEQIWGNVTLIDISYDTKRLDVTIENEQYTFYFETRLVSLLEKYDTLTAVYHFALMCCNENDEYNVILKRLKIKDCYTTEFNPFFLKAAESRIFVKPIKGMKMYERVSNVASAPANFNCEVNPSLYFTHREISVAESVSLCDFRRKRVNSSTIVEKVNTNRKRPILFKKMGERDRAENQINVVNGPGGEYVLAKSLITKHFSRLNGKELLLCETACWYDDIGKERSKKVTEQYTNIDCIPSSNTPCVVDGHKFLPEFLLLSCGRVLKKRLVPKVLSYPMFEEHSFKYMYSKLLLFAPLDREEDLHHANVQDYFLRRDNEGSVIVIKNER